MSASNFVAALFALSLLLVMVPVAASERTEVDFFKACTASSNLSPAVCECSARKAKGELTAEEFTLLVATLAGNDKLVAQLRSKLPAEQVMKSGTFMLRGPSQCAKESAATA